MRRRPGSGRLKQLAERPVARRLDVQPSDAVHGPESILRDAAVFLSLCTVVQVLPNDLPSLPLWIIYCYIVTFNHLNSE